MRRRTLIIIASTIVLLGLVVGLYMLVFSDAAELTVTDNPFGDIGSELASIDALDETDSGAGTEFAPRLIRITDQPVARGVVAIIRISTTTVAQPIATPTEQVVSLDTATGTSSATTTLVIPAAPVVTETVERDTEVRFIDRASGNIYRYLAHERSLTRLSNKTLPGIQRASWLPDGSRAFVQFLSGEGDGEYVATYVLPDSGEGGFFLEQNLAVAKAVGANSLFTLLSGTTGSVGSVSNADGTGARTLFTSLLSSLVVHPTSANYYGATRASAQLDGYAFLINATNGGFSRILGPFRGLSIRPSPAGDRVLYSYVDRGTLRLGMLEIASRSVTALPVATLAEKCVWAPSGSAVYCGVPLSLPQNLPDSWYQGAVAFTDRLWRIDMESRIATLVTDPVETADVSIDAVALETDPEEDILFFTDKPSGALWAYDL